MNFSSMQQTSMSNLKDSVVWNDVTVEGSKSSVGIFDVFVSKLPPHEKGTALVKCLLLVMLTSFSVKYCRCVTKKGHTVVASRRTG